MKNRIVISMMVLAMAGATLTGCGSTEADVVTEVSTEETFEEAPNYLDEEFVENMDTSGYLFDIVESESLSATEALEILYATQDAGGYTEMNEDDDDKEPHYFDVDGELICTDSYVAYLATLELEEFKSSLVPSVDIWEGKDDISFTDSGMAYVCLADMSDSEVQDLLSQYETEVAGDGVCVITPEGDVEITGVDGYEELVRIYSEAAE